MLKLRTLLIAVFISLLGCGGAWASSCVTSFLQIQSLINQDIVSGVNGGIRASTVNSLMNVQNNCYVNIETLNPDALTALAIEPNTTGGLATWPTSGGGAVSSVANSDGTLTISPTTGAVVASINLGHANSWAGVQTFGASDIVLTGAGTGCATFTSGVLSGTGSSCGTATLSFPLTVSGTTTSGGIPYFSSTTVLSSSGLLAANAIMLGGGAGAAPTTTTTGSGVVT